MVRVLVLDEARRQDDRRPDPPEHARQPDRVRGADFQVRIAVQLDEFERRAEQRGSPLGLGVPLGGRAVRRRLAPRADNQVRRPAGAVSSATTPPQPNSMSSGWAPKARSGAAFRRVVRCRLHRPGRWCHGRRR